MSGIIGKKIGMTQLYTESGELLAITAIEAGPCPVLAVKEKSIQLGFDLAREKSVKRPIAGYFKKINVAPRKIIREFLKEAGREYNVGEELKVDLFKPGDLVDVTGVSIGKGFQGGMKRWHWSGGPQSHGSTSHRRVGSMGSTTTPGRVWKGHHLAGHMGAQRVTLQNLQVIKIDAQNNLLLIKGAVPGSKNSYVMIRTAKKQKSRKIIQPKAASAAKKGTTKK